MYVFGGGTNRKFNFVGYPRKQLSCKICTFLLQVSGNRVPSSLHSGLFTSACNCNGCVTRSYLCYPASCQGSSTGELKVNVRGQGTPKYFKHSAPKYLKCKVCHCRVHWERKALPYSQGNYLAGTNPHKP